MNCCPGPSQLNCSPSTPPAPDRQSPKRIASRVKDGAHRAVTDIAHTKASEFPSGKKPKIENIAKTGSMEALYEITYRSLSNGAAHAGLSAIAKYFEDENGAQADAPFCGPSHVGTPEILNLAILALTQGIARATPHMDIGDDLRKELEQLIELSRTL